MASCPAFSLSSLALDSARRRRCGTYASRSRGTSCCSVWEILSRGVSLLPKGVAAAGMHAMRLDRVWSISIGARALHAAMLSAGPGSFSYHCDSPALHSLILSRSRTYDVVQCAYSAGVPFAILITSYYSSSSAQPGRLSAACTSARGRRRGRCLQHEGSTTRKWGPWGGGGILTFFESTLLFPADTAIFIPGP